nr:unnamed protein product [Digitaria exilis]
MCVRAGRDAPVRNQPAAARLEVRPCGSSGSARRASPSPSKRAGHPWRGRGLCWSRAPRDGQKPRTSGGQATSHPRCPSKLHVSPECVPLQWTGPSCRGGAARALRVQAPNT